jgi:ATP-dependent RNA circularization protein (DNA/RNA ligase family)
MAREKATMSDFFRFPHTPHIAWLSTGTPRDDKVLSIIEAQQLLAQDVIVEEKLDGANLGFSVSANGELLAQNRGQYLTKPYVGQFEKLENWLKPRADSLFDALGENLMLFGEWCAAQHSLDYQTLPDWFLVFDVYDKQQQQFWSVTRRNQLATQLDLAVVPEVFRGRITLAQLKERIEQKQSLYRDGHLEGLVIRQDSQLWCEKRAKLVRADFTQAITDHWRKKRLQWNQIDFVTSQRKII